MKTVSCDILVIGGGGSGLVAGCRAATLGKKVIVLEKDKHLGGGMNHASTMRTFGSKWQKDRSLPDTTALYMRNRMDETFWRIDQKFAANVIRGTGEFFDWFCETAPEGTADMFEVGRYVFDDESDGPLGPQRSNRKYEKGGGRLIVEVCSEKLLELGGEILTETVPEKLLTQDGKVVGAVVCQKGETFEILCKSVILACGAWIRNAEFVAKHYPMLSQAQKFMSMTSPHQNKNYTGDGLALAAAAGAKMDEKNLTIRMMGPGVRSVSKVITAIPQSAYPIYVNKNGKRYICEVSRLRLGLFDSGIVQLYQPDGQTYVIFDRNTLSHAIADGENQPKASVPMPFPGASFPSTLEEALEDISHALEKNSDTVFCADTLEELADKLDIDKAAFLQTVADYNAYCETGMDWDCYKPSDWLVPINEGPFYAVTTALDTDGAFGGVEVDEKMRAKAENGGVVAGLYVVGDLASGRFINMADVKMQILNDMSFALSSGFIAGTTAAESV